MGNVSGGSNASQPVRRLFCFQEQEAGAIERAELAILKALSAYNPSTLHKPPTQSRRELEKRTVDSLTVDTIRGSESYSAFVIDQIGLKYFSQMLTEQADIAIDEHGGDTVYYDVVKMRNPVVFHNAQLGFVFANLSPLFGEG